jgi:hypothetical protein
MSPDPSCRHPRPRRIQGRLTCLECGAVIDEPAATREASPAAAPALAWRRLAIGASIGTVLVFIGGFPRFILETLAVLIHETGHAAAAWLVARPAIPKFDLQYGGGVTPIGEQSGFILGLLGLGAAYLLWFTWKRERHWFYGALALVALPVFLLLSGLDQPWFIGAGHGAEVIMACVFLVRAATGIGIANRADGILSALIGSAMWWLVVIFAWSLMYDQSFRESYQGGKGGVLTNDLTHLSMQSGMSVESLAMALLLFAVVALMAAAWVSLTLGGSPEEKP